MYTRSFFVSLVALGVSCGGSAIDQGAEPDDRSATVTGGAPSHKDPVTSGGVASGGGSTWTGGSRTPSGTGGSRPLDPATGGMGGIGGEAPVRENPTPISSAACSLPASVPEDMKLELSIDLGFISVTLPPGYDGAVPGPIIIAFPASSDSFGGLVAASPVPNPLLNDYIIARARPVYSDGSTWEGQSVEGYDTVYRELASQVCFDEARVVGVGNGGGGRFLVWMTTEPKLEGVVRPSDFLAMALTGPVGKRNDPWPDVPLLFMHSTLDERGQTLWNDADGQHALEVRRLSQGCDETPVAAGLAVRNETTYVCSDFTGCTSALRFCSHDKPTRLDDWEWNHNIELHRFFADYL